MSYDFKLLPSKLRGIPELKAPSLELLVIKVLVAAEGSGIKITTGNLKSNDVDHCAGIPELKVPSLEPLVIKELVAAEGSGIKITTENLKVFGCSNFTIQKLDVNLKTHQYLFNIKLPHLVLDGRYIIDGRILLIPIRGRGRLTGDIFNAKANVSLSGQIIKKHGEDYLHYHKMTIKIKVVTGKLRLDNLFGGEPVLGEVINSAINANFEQFMNELRPIVEKALAKFMLESADGIASSFPYKDLFPV
ncbi:hypothetical protein J6590_064704 [Homalodisca vitripennis]|nr:hypothetical protein J6590_064704 [Homalodisca vitripennis]